MWWRSAKKLSVREIEQLAYGYFRGPESFRQQILSGNIALPLDQMRQVEPPAEGCTDFERVLLRDLEITQKYMQRVMGKSQEKRPFSAAFTVQAHLLTAGILSRTRSFSQTLQVLHDRCEQA